MAASAVAPRRSHAPRPTRRAPTEAVSPPAPFDLSQLNGLERVYQVGSQTVVARTLEGREVRVTAKRDLRAGTYRAEYERRATIKNGDKTYMIWAKTPAHKRVEAADAKTCIEQALQDVNWLHL